MKRRGLVKGQTIEFAQPIGLPEGQDDVMGGAIRPTVAASLGADAAAATPLLYGGSVNPGNAADFAAVPSINGALVGGASLDADAFLSVAQAFAASGSAV